MQPHLSHVQLVAFSQLHFTRTQSQSEFNIFAYSSALRHQAEVRAIHRFLARNRKLRMGRVQARERGEDGATEEER